MLHETCSQHHSRPGLEKVNNPVRNAERIVTRRLRQTGSVYTARKARTASRTREAAEPNLSVVVILTNRIENDRSASPVAGPAPSFYRAHIVARPRQLEIQLCRATPCTIPTVAPCAASSRGAITLHVTICSSPGVRRRRIVPIEVACQTKRSAVNPRTPRPVNSGTRRRGSDSDLSSASA